MNQKNALAHFEHLKDLKKLSNLTICNNINNLEELMIDAKKMSNKTNKEKIDKERDFFLSYNSNKSFQDILAENLN